MSQSQDTILRYLQDAVAAEGIFETQLRTLAKEGNDSNVQELFRVHADQTHLQYRRLRDRLETLGGQKSTLKSFLGHVFGLAPKIPQLGQETADKNTQNLVIAYGVEHTEIAMYEALARAAEAASDHITAQIAIEIQAEERAFAEKIWQILGSTSRESFQQVVSG